MASHKRASMREGPLAALFRRTDKKADERPASAPAPEAEEVARPGEPDRASAQPQQPAAEAAPPEPHPRPARTPEQRLKAAFSSDIPFDMLSHSAQAESRYAASTAPGVHKPALRVVGVGGAGVNAVNRMVEAGVEDVEFLAINTDLQSLQQSAADVTIHIGSEVTRGLGSGSDPSIGARAAEQEYDKIKRLLKGSDMVFIAAGAGGGTGTGAGPVVARIAREVDALTVGIVTKPFGFEGSRRKDQADRGVEELGKEVDTLITIPNDRLLAVLDRGTSMVDAFQVADDVLRQGVQGISDLVTLPGLINLDFADVRTIMSKAGNALLGIGMGVGERRAMEAAEQAVGSPLLETSVDGARSILLSITGGRDLSLWEVNEAAKAVADAAHPDANIIFGAMVDEKVEDQVWVTVVATGYGDRPVRRTASARRREGIGSGRAAPARAASGVANGRPAAADFGGDLEIPEFVPRT